MKLGANATQGAAGMAAGTITVKNGAQFDLNYTDTTSALDRDRAKITSGKKFVIEGEGPDGNGALTSSSGNTLWSNPIGIVEMTGDATIGGNSRIDLRGNANSNAVIGPDDATLTVKNSPSTDYGLYLSSGRSSVGKVVVTESGKLGFESNGTRFEIPNGIDLYGLFRFYSGDPTWNVGGGIRAYGANARIGNNNGTAYVRTPLTVTSGATLTMNGSATTYYTGVVTNEGTIVMNSGTHRIEGGDLVNVGNPLLRKTHSTACHLYPTKVTGDMRLELTSGQFWLSGRSDWGDAALAATVSSEGSFVIGNNTDGYGLPKFGKNKLSVAASGNALTYFHPSTSASIDGLPITGKLKTFYCQGPTTGALIDMQAKDVSFSTANFFGGTTSGRGEHTFFGPATSLSADLLEFGNAAGNNFKVYYGMITVKEGLLSIGTGGIVVHWRHPMRQFLNMEGGTLRAAGNFGPSKYGATLNFGNPKKGGAVDFDLNGKTVRWSTGLVGGSDVTVKGAGTFTTQRPGVQGIPLGKWTVESTSGVDLRNAAGFAGGLALAADTSATLDIAGTNMVEMVFWNWHDNAWNTLLPLYNNGSIITPHVASSLTFINRTASTITESKNPGDNNATKNKSFGLNYLGQFYVNADQVGTWSFKHRFKTHFGLMIDDTELSRPGPNTDTTVSKELTEGWHNFMISAYSGDANPSVGPYSGADALTFKAPGDSAYTVFDSTTVPMRMRQHLGARTSVRWRKYMSYGDSASVYADADESKYTTLDVVTNSLQVIHQKFSTGVNAPLGGASARFDGYFKVAPEQEGTWTFNAKFDDRIALSVDGRRLFAGNTGSASMTLRAGWHKFDIRTGDTTPSGNTTYGTGGGLTDSVGNTVALEFKVNGGAYFAFDERYLPIAYTAGDAQKFEEPGLGGEIELAAGSTLTNAPRDGGFCPIYGTLKGTGTLAGPYRFTGEDNCWEVTGTRTLSCVKFTNADANTLAGLKSLKVTFDREPKRRRYELSDALGLTAESAANVALTVADEDGNDYGDRITLTVKDDKLVLSNSKFSGMHIIIR